MRYERITLAQAQELYAEHKDLVMVPCRLRPDCFMAVSINANSSECMVYESFASMVNAFRYYNCINRETGRGVAFYVET